MNKVNKVHQIWAIILAGLCSWIKDHDEGWFWWWYNCRECTNEYGGDYNDYNQVYNWSQVNSQSNIGDDDNDDDKMLIGFNMLIIRVKSNKGENWNWNSFIQESWISHASQVGEDKEKDYDEYDDDGDDDDGDDDGDDGDDAGDDGSGEDCWD